MGKISFHDQIARNKRKSVFLVFIVFIVIVALGYAISFAFSPDYFFGILILATIISIVYVMITYYKGDKIALASVRAKKADPVAHKQLYNAVDNMSLASGMPRPKVYVMESENINAFATGRNPEVSSMCLTTGALNKLNKQELEGVVGHEMGHIANYDIKFITAIAVMVGAISIFSQIFLRSLWYGGAGARGGRAGGRDGGQGNAIILVIAIVMAILAPLLVRLVQLAISRKREFAADATSVQFTRYPPGLIGALRKIKHETKNMKVPDAVAPMFFSSAIKQKHQVSGILQTHPPIGQRIKVLERM